MDNERRELLARIASLYFEEDLSQAQVAARTGYSPSMVSRLLKEARENGIFEIRINYPLGRRTDLEQQLQKELCLRTVRVVRCGPLQLSEVRRRVGTMAARLTEEYIHDNMMIGLTWGTGVYETVNALRMRSDTGVQVIQLLGSLNSPNPVICGPELSQQLARTLGGRYSTLPVPMIVDNEETRQALLNDSSVRRVMSQFREVELAIVGIGTLFPLEQSTVLTAGYVTSQQLQELQAAGAVGDVCSIFFDCQGRVVNTPLTRLIIRIDAASFAAIPLRVGVAAGAAKKVSIIAASRAGLINVLVTDDTAAESILQELKENVKQDVVEK